MNASTTEKDFENDVEMLMDRVGWRTIYNETEGLPHADNNACAQVDYDCKLALKVDSLIGFVQETQPEEWAKIEGLYGAHTRERFLKRLTDELERPGDPNSRAPW